MSAATDDGPVGHCRPPSSTRFQKGRSGNPKGRPKGSRRADAFDRVLGQLVTVREDGVERHVTAAEAFIMQLMKRALEGDGVATRQTLEAIEAAKALGLTSSENPLRILIRSFATPNCALEQLRMARVLDSRRDSARLALEPWMVEAALRRIDRRLTVEEQQVVLQATRTPRKVNWPQWWTVTG